MVRNVTQVDGKFDILYSLATVSLNSPKENIEAVIYPEVSADTLKALVNELDHKGHWYEYQVNRNMHSFYAYHARPVLFSILDMLEFKSSNPAEKPILKALSLIKKHRNSDNKYFPASEEVPITELISTSWNHLISHESDPDKESSKTLVNRFNYEMAIFELLRVKFSYKGIWVEGGHRYRDPDSDVPTDFYDNQLAYLKDLDLPSDPDEFIKSCQTEMAEKLQKLNDELPFNQKVKILKRKKKSHIKISPSSPKEEPPNLILLQNEILRRWPAVNLLDLLKEVDSRTDFTQHFQTIASNVKMPKGTLRKRLILSLCALGSNTGLKRMSASNGDENYSDLQYIKRRFINEEVRWS